MYIDDLFLREGRRNMVKILLGLLKNICEENYEGYYD